MNSNNSKPRVYPTRIDIPEIRSPVIKILNQTLATTSKQIFQPNYRRKALSYLGLGVLSVTLSAIPAFGAERIAFFTLLSVNFRFLLML